MSFKQTITLPPKQNPSAGKREITGPYSIVYTISGETPPYIVMKFTVVYIEGTIPGDNIAWEVDGVFTNSTKSIGLIYPDYFPYSTVTRNVFAIVNGKRYGPLLIVGY